MVKTSKQEIGRQNFGIPRWLEGQLTQGDYIQIENTIAEAETKTSGEIVPIIVRRSIPLQSHSILGSLICVFLFFVLAVTKVGDWFDYRELLLVALGLLVSAAVGWFLGRLSFFHRILQHPEDAARLALHRAELEFHRAGIGATQGSTGIILFLSIEDRQAVVLADKGIADKLPAETWGEVMSLMLAGVKQGKPALGLQHAIIKCGEILSNYFPIQNDDTNELVNRLIVKE